MTEPATPFKNRIVGSGDEDPEQLLANPLNWRIHPKHQQDALAAVLDDVGWVQQVIVNRITSHVIDGHLRVALAISRGEATVPVLYVELSLEEEQLILAALDPLAGMAVADAGQLDDLLRGLDSKNEMINSLLSDIRIKTGVLDLTTLGEPPEHDENDGQHVKMVTCPECGHVFPS